MMMAIAISVFFGLVAAIALISCHASMRRGLVRYGEIRAELAAMDRGSVKVTVPLRRPQEAFIMLAA